MFQIKVARMNCGGCAKSVTRAIHAVDTGATVAVDLAGGTVAITSPAGTPAGRFVDAVRAAGYGADALPLAE
ncbi:heavy-metal-associated domain-containing protein [Methylobacterium sp. C25]|uniref:heavy-metal-associated domain-containing protein n=1 Tax=Methylobacterium sp. C25 TaxID=2721622 RepID=UPI001F2B9874|nr:heavy-metal-associated domain-containing protein [Methylobacterium sp. C25]MCE4226276.1 heavy-metal-associated domain-containing protein [Methylobacterium sp. C25]